MKSSPKILLFLAGILIFSITSGCSNHYSCQNLPKNGMLLTLEVDSLPANPEAKAEVIARTIEVLKKRFKIFGIKERCFCFDGNTISCFLPKQSLGAERIHLLTQTGQLHLNLLREPAELDRALRIIDAALTPEKSNNADETFARSLFGPQKKPGEPPYDFKNFRDLFILIDDQIGAYEWEVATISAILKKQNVYEALSRAGLDENIFLWDCDSIYGFKLAPRRLYYMKATPEISGDFINEARIQAKEQIKHDDAQANLDPITTSILNIQPPEFDIEIDMTPDGASELSRMTGSYVNHFIAIALDSTVLSVPRVIQKISSGRMEISGAFSKQQAYELAGILKSGALPIRVRNVSYRELK